MKKLTAVFALFLFIQHSFGQTYGDLEWQKTKIPATIIEIPQSASVTEDAIKQKLTQLGYSGKESKGVTVYKGVLLQQISADLIDLYLKVERKGKKDREECTVYFAVAKVNSFIKPGGDAAMVAGINSYIANFPVWAEAEALERDINNAEDVLKSAEKKNTDLVDESESLQKRKKKLEDDIEENRKNIEKQKAEVENKRRALDILKAKRKT
jgi:hypothetical protein